MNVSLRLLTALLILFSTLTHAEYSDEEQFGDYKVYYSVFNTSFLSPEVAEAYGITRAKDRALINISIQWLNWEKEWVPQQAMLNGTEFDLIHRNPIAFQEVQEQHALYYIAEVKIQHKIPVYYTVNIMVDPDKQPLKLEFSKVLFVDGKD